MFRFLTKNNYPQSKSIGGASGIRSSPSQVYYKTEVFIFKNLARFIG